MRGGSEDFVEAGLEEAGLEEAGFGAGGLAGAVMAEEALALPGAASAGLKVRGVGLAARTLEVSGAVWVARAGFVNHVSISAERVFGRTVLEEVSETLLALGAKGASAAIRCRDGGVAASRLAGSTIAVLGD
jgi:hypothetical protein